MAHLAEAYSRRGSVRETEYFLKRGLEISTQMQAPYAEGYMRMQEIDVLSRKNLWDSCADTLQKIRAVSEDQAGKPAADVVGAMEAAGAFMLEGDSWRRCKDYRRAHEAYRRAMDLIEDMSAGAVAEEVSLIAANPAKMTPRLERIIGQMSPVQKPAVGDSAIRASGSNEAAMQLAVTRDDLATRQQLLASIAGTVDEAQRQQSNNSDSQAARCIDERPEYLLMQANLLFVELQRMLEEEESWSTVLSSTLMFPALQRSRAQKPRRGTIKALIKGKLAELEELLALAVPAAITIGSAHCVHESCHLLALTKAMGIAFGLSSSDAECAGDVIARVIDGAKNITAVREAVDALRHRGEDVPSQLTLWPTDIRDNNGGTSDDAQGFGSDAGSSPLGYRLGANRLSSARPNKPKMPHASGSPEPLLSSLKRLSLAGNGADSDSSEDGAESQDQVLMRAVDGNRVVSGWAGTADAQSYSLCSTLPPSWIACGISIDRSRNVMFITRYQNGHEPVAICLPMRAIEIAGADALRNGLDDEKNPDVFDEVYQNLRAIIAESDETMKTGSNCKTDDEKRRWWLHRTQLDKQLKDLLEGIEDQWLGGFRSILQPKDSPDCGIDVSLLQRAIQQCIIKSLPKTFAAKAKLLDLSHTTCLFVLHVATRIWHQQNSRDADQSNDWLDVCSMLLDAYCYQGAAPALDEEGISKFADALKDAVLDVVGGADISDQPSAKTGQRKHLILVLDKHAQQIPWECLPCLCDYPISRVPSVAFLQHRLSLIAPGSRSAWSSKRANSDASGLLFESLGKRAGCPNARGSSEHAFSPVPSLAPSLANLGSRNNESNMPSLVLVDQDQLSHPPGVSVDGSRVFYILNPEGDLHRTQSNFEGYLRGQASWHGVLGRKPMNHECEHGISSSDLFLYFGHGGAEKYISRTQIHKLRRCAVSLLVGCSSGQLRPAGEYDAMGTAMDYMISGCPALVANLWDVGDKDIDRFTAEMLHLWGLDEHTSGKHAVKIDTKRGSKAPVRPVSLAEAVCSARRACRMAFLTGAAPVVYGIPAYLY
ncbi:separin protein [Dipsacomyces acuminosporus]|nr:separin protein [Dipsacomyces acuminosporus]